MKNPSAGPDTRNMTRFSRALAVSVAAGVVTTFLLLSVFAALMTVRDLPHSAVVPLSIFGVAVGTILAGYCCARILRERGLLWGLGCGSDLFAGLFLRIDASGSACRRSGPLQVYHLCGQRNDWRGARG